ncbi:MAG: TlpA family protein disulfide reductase [Fimbriimonas sp.]
MVGLLIGALGAILASPIGSLPSDPWSSVPKEIRQSRKAHIEASIAKTDFWMVPYLKGEQNLEPFTRQGLDPNPAYAAVLAQWAKDKRDIVRAVAFSEELRLLLAMKDMTVGVKDFASILDRVPALTDPKAQAIAAESVIVTFPFTERGVAALGKIYPNNPVDRDRWILAGRNLEAMQEDRKVTPDQARLLGPAPKGWIPEALSTSLAGGLKEGDRMQKMDYTTWDGKLLRLDSLHGKPVVLIHTAWWCGACRNEIRELGTIMKEGRSRGIEFVIVSGDLDVARTLSWLKAEEAQAPVVWSPGALGLYSSLLGVRGWPRITCIDRDFRVSRLDLDPNTRLASLRGWIDEVAPLKR